MISKPTAKPTETVTNEDRMVCFCYTVRLKLLKEAIESGADSLEKLKQETNASCGCGGCEWDVLSVLEDARSTKKIEKN
jgi:bacterioferritin-associated ferredoxin